MSHEPEHVVLTRYDYDGKVIEQTDETAAPPPVNRTIRNTYWGSGHLRTTTITQDTLTATVRRHYDGAGRPDSRE